MGLFSSLAGAVAGPLVGGIFSAIQGNKARAAASQGTDFVRLRKNAERAGFNPLTALMATGGSGFQRSFAPDLSTGAFISEAVSRAADTYFNQNVSSDAEAEGIKRKESIDAAVAEAMAYKPPPSTFGYDLTSQKLAASPVSVSSGPISDPVRPVANPLTVDLSYVPVRLPDGTPGQLENSIARRLDIKPYDVISAGDWEEIAGETPLSDFENMVFSNGIRKTATGTGFAQPAQDTVRGVFFPPFSSNNNKRSDPVDARKRAYSR